TFARAGKVTISGGTMPLRIDAVNAGGVGAEVFDMAQYGYTSGVGLNMTGNSHISVSNLQLGNAGVPVVRSNTSSSPLYLNLWRATDVVIGSTEPDYINMGLRVRGTGMSTFSGALGVGTATPNPAYKLHVVGNANFDGTVTGTNIKAHYQDGAEWVPSLIPPPPATVVVLDPARSNHVTPSLRSYDSSVAGVVSAQPGI